MRTRDANAYLFDAITTHRHKVFRWEADLVRSVVATFRDGFENLKTSFDADWRLLRPDIGGPVNRSLVLRLKDSVQRWARGGVERASLILREGLFRIGQEEAEAQEKILAPILTMDVSEASQVEREGIRAAMKAGAFQALARETIEEVLPDYETALEMAADGAAAGSASAVIRGMSNGETFSEVWNRADIEATRMLVMTGRTVNSAVGLVTNKVADEVHGAVAKEVPQEQFVATLDEKCCLLCAGLDGSIWDYNDGKKPIPPMHPSCHCYLVPTKVDWGFYGFTEPMREAWVASNENALKFVQPGLVKVPGRTRRIRVKSRTLWRVPGNWSVKKLPAKVEYEGWFKLQPAKVQKMILGPGRYDLWKTGKVANLKAFATRDRIIPLKELAA